VAWFLLLYKPLSNNLSATTAQLDEVQQQISTANGVTLPSLLEAQKTAPQTEADLLRLNKMLPAQSGIPSLIVELEETASQSGLNFVSIQPGQVTMGNPFGVESMTPSFSGMYFDFSDFVSRLEKYVQMTNTTFTVTGRLLQIAQIQISGGGSSSSGSTSTSTGTSPTLTISVTVNFFLWNGSSAPLVAPTATPTPSASATPTASTGGSLQPAPRASGSSSPAPSDTTQGSSSGAAAASSSPTSTPTSTGSTSP
jgi:Tfp pilus assembly protein PilO